MTSFSPEFDQYLQSTYLVDSDHPTIIQYAQETVEGLSTPKEMAIALYYRVRDDFKYSPYEIILEQEVAKASHMLTKESGYCIEKANVLVAASRVVGIPSRFGFANVRNHIGTERLEKFLRTDLMVFHGFVELYIEGKWVKATPAFNKSLCEMLNVDPLEFDGTEDSMLQEYDQGGGKYMEFVHDYGTFADWPFELFIAELKKHYPHLFEGSSMKLIG